MPDINEPTEATPDLLPCPFCGGRPNSVPQNSERVLLLSALAAHLRAIPHNPQASSGGAIIGYVDRRMQCFASVETHSAEYAEAAAPKPDPAIAELVERLIGTKKWLAAAAHVPIMCSTERAEAVSDAIATLTTSNDRVAELERERDDLQRAWLGQRKRAEAAERERDDYLRACKSAGVCMSCVHGAPDPYGCTDCLNTGFDMGLDNPRAEAAEAEIRRLSEALAAAEYVIDRQDAFARGVRVRDMDEALERYRRARAAISPTPNTPGESHV